MTRPTCSVMRSSCSEATRPCMALTLTLRARLRVGSVEPTNAAGHLRAALVDGVAGRAADAGQHVPRSSGRDARVDVLSARRG